MCTKTNVCFFLWYHSSCFNNPQASSLVIFCKPQCSFLHLQLILKYYYSNSKTVGKLRPPELEKIQCLTLAQCQHIEDLTSVKKKKKQCVKVCIVNLRSEQIRVQVPPPLLHSLCVSLNNAECTESVWNYSPWKRCVVKLHSSIMESLRCQFAFVAKLMPTVV